MAIHASPGVYYEIQDYSTYVSELSSTTLALIGKTVKGPTVPTFISSVRQFTDTFGLPRTGDYSALAAISYLEYGNALWFRRLVGSDATKASADIPAANEVDPEEIERVEDQFIYSVDLNSEPIPETLEIKLYSDTNSFNPVYIRDTEMYTTSGQKFGLLNPDKYPAITSDVNYVKYGTGDFRVQLASLDETKSLIAKIIRNSNTINCTEDNSGISDVTLTKGTHTIEGTINWSNQGYKSSIKKSSFIFDFSVDSYDYRITVDSDGNFICVNSRTNKQIILEEKTLDLYTGDFKFKFLKLTDKGSVETTADLPTSGQQVGDMYKVLQADATKTHVPEEVKANDIVYWFNNKWIVKSDNIASTDDFTSDTAYLNINLAIDQFKWQVLGIGKAFTNNFGSAVNKNSIYLYLKDTTSLSTLDDWSKALANEFDAIAYDENGEFVETDAGKDKLQKGTVIYNTDSTQDPDVFYNAVNYTSKKLNFVLSEPISEDTNILISYNAKLEIEYGALPSDRTFTVTIPYKTVNSSIAIFIEDDDNNRTQIGAVDSDDNIIGVGKIDSNGNIIGEISVGSVDLDSTGENTIIECIYKGNNTTTPIVYKSGNVVISFIQSMGKVVSRSYGDGENGIQLKFILEDFKSITDSTNYYGLKIWDADTLSTQTPQEFFRKFTLGSDINKSTHFINSVTSTLVEFELYDSTLKPILNNLITLGDGYDDAESIDPSDAIKALDDFGNTETYDINLIAVPDYPGDKSIAFEMISLCENTRGDCFCIIDPPANLSVQNVVNWHNGDGIYASENALNSSQAALYYPWVKISNEFTESVEWVPPSVKIVSVYAYNDNNAEQWYAPAGLNRGRIFNCLGTEREITLSDRDLMYATDTNAINPICDFVGDGIVVYGQKTLQRKPSALDRVNVVRLILYITKVLATSVKYLLFEPHDEITWTRYILLVNPFLQNIKGRRGLYSYSVKCDSTTNTDSDIDNNTMVAEVVLQPTKAVERIITRYKITGQSTSTEIVE